MKNLLIGLLIGILFLTACGGTSPTAQMMPNAAVVQTISTPSPIPTATRTVFPTFTPEPTTTFTPTEPPLPPIDLSKSIVWGPDGTPVLSPRNTVMIETTKGFDIFPKVQELEKQLGAPSSTPEFIRRWHASLWKAQVNGVPVVQPIDPSTVCNIPLPLSSGTTEGYDGTSFDWITTEKTTCKPGTFFQYPVGIMYDNRPTIVGGDGKIYSTPIFGITMAIYDPYTTVTRLRTYVYSKVDNNANNILGFFRTEGAFFNLYYNFHQGTRVNSYSRQWTLDWFGRLDNQNKLRQKDPNYPVIYDPAMVDRVASEKGFFAPELSETAVFGAPNMMPIMP